MHISHRHRVGGGSSDVSLTTGFSTRSQTLLPRQQCSFSESFQNSDDELKHRNTYLCVIPFKKAKCNMMFPASETLLEVNDGLPWMVLQQK